MHLGGLGSYLLILGLSSLHKMNLMYWMWPAWHSARLSVPAPNLLKVVYEEQYCSICSTFWWDNLCMNFIYSVYLRFYINLKYRINLLIFSERDVCTKHSYIFWCIKNMMKVYVSLCWLILIMIHNSSHKKTYSESTCTLILSNTVHIFPVLFFRTQTEEKSMCITAVTHRPFFFFFFCTLNSWLLTK